MSKFTTLQQQDQPHCISAQIAEKKIDSMQDCSRILVTVLMPCLNEAHTLAACIQQAHAGCTVAITQRLHSARNLLRSAVESAGAESQQIAESAQSERVAVPMLTYEILVADNGSTDESIEIALANGARVVCVEQKGYGAALLAGIVEARGMYIVMGDSDRSYDFGEVPKFLDKLEEGYDLVMGNRFAGGIEQGAMPWHHRYFGNPILSGVGRLLYPSRCRDWHCGLRASDRKKVLGLGLTCTGMEFASEMVIQASLQYLSIAEIPVVLYPDGRNRPPHLRSFRDGWRHLKLIVGTRLKGQVECRRE